MTSLHSIKPAINRQLARAAAMLHRDYPSITRFRVTGATLTELQNDYSTPLQYFHAMRWEGWTNHSLRNYADTRGIHRAPTEEQIDAAYGLFEAMA